MEQKLILFDIDKTLIDEIERDGDPWQLSFNAVYGIDCPITLLKSNAHGMTMKEIAIETMKNKGLKEDEILEKLDLFIQNLEKFYMESLKNGKVVLFPKIPELLQKLSDKKYIVGLVTGNTRIIAFAKLKKSGIDKFFTIGGFGDDSADRKDLFKLALKRAKDKYDFQLEKKNVFVIGDTPKDIFPAKKLNLQTIGVATGIYSKKDLSDAGADFVLDDLEDIEKVLSIIQ